MNDPFFSAVDEAQPVFASKILQPEEVTNFDKYSTKNNFNKNDIPKSSPHTYEFQNRNHDRQYPPSRNSSHHLYSHRNTDDRNFNEPKPRLPSMLNDIKGPKPLKINPNKPPQSKKFFNVQIPDHYTYAKPYDDV